MNYNEFKFNNITSIRFKDTNEMDEYHKNFDNHLIAGIIFESDDLLHYTIRVNGSVVPSSDSYPIINYSLGRYQASNGIIESDRYMDIFLPVQAAVDQGIIRLKTNDDTFNLAHYVGKLAKPASEYVDKYEDKGNSISYNISAMFLASISTILTSLVKEKETKIKESLLMTGVHPTIFWLSWLILYILAVAIISGLSTTLFYFTEIFSNLNLIILFISIFLYGLSCCNIAFLTSTFFKNTKTASTIISVIMIILIFINFVISYIDINIRKILSFIFSPLSIGSFIQEFYIMSIQEENHTINQILISNCGTFLIGLLFNNFLYFILAIIFDNFCNDDNNRYFFNRSIKIKNPNENKSNYYKDIQEDIYAKNNIQCSVEISQVYKIFKKRQEKNKNIAENYSNCYNNINNNKSFLAVDDVSFKAYRNEIFAIL
eukprot:jgi/Orpsp1_1/1175453/evm.model.c7180000053954.1